MARASVKLAICPALILAGTALVCAQTPARPASINIQAAILSTKEGQQATQDLSAKFSSRKQALDKRQADITALQSRLRAGSATMTPAAKDKLIGEIDAQTKAWNRDSADFSSDVQQEETQAMSAIGRRMLAIIEKYALQHGISLVADVSNPQTPLIWADPTIDITNDIIKLYDEAHPPVTAATPPAAPAPAAKKP